MDTHEEIGISVVAAEPANESSSQFDVDFFDWDSWSGGAVQGDASATIAVAETHNIPADPAHSHLLFSSHNYSTDYVSYTPDSQNFSVTTDSQNLQWVQQLPFYGAESPHLLGIAIPQDTMADDIVAAALNPPSPLLSPVSSSSLADALGPINPYSDLPSPSQRLRSQSFSSPREVSPPVGRPRGSTFTEGPVQAKVEERVLDWSSVHHPWSGTFNSIPGSSRDRPSSVRSTSGQRSPSPYQRPVGRHRSGSDVSVQSNISSLTGSLSSSLPPPSPSPSISASSGGGGDLGEGSSGFKEVVATEAIKAAGRANRKRTAIFTCEVCRSTFTAKQRLKTHWNSHFNIRDHECTICDQRFGQLSDLKRHQKSRKHQIAARRH